MSKYPVTQEQWYAVSLMDYIDIHLAPTPSKFKKENGPVERVSWEEATEFCKRLSHHAEQLYRYAGQIFRLPCEAEWEYACRALTDSPYCFGENIAAKQSNFRGTIGETTSVDSYPPNDFGLYDMHGNVREWCLDLWHSNYENAPIDGIAWVEDGENDRRVIRGGSWADAPGFCRSASRSSYFPGALGYDIGFRVVLSPQ